MPKNIITKSYRFAISGIIVTAVHVLIAIILIDIFLVIPAIANGAAFICANIFSYMLNTLWSFSQTPDSASFVKFITVSLVGGVVAVSISGVADYYGLHYLVGILLVVIVVPPATFLSHYFWTYR